MPIPLTGVRVDFTNVFDDGTFENYRLDVQPEAMRLFEEALIARVLCGQLCVHWPRLFVQAHAHGGPQVPRLDAAVSSPWPIVGLEAVRLLAFPF